MGDEGAKVNELRSLICSLLVWSEIAAGVNKGYVMVTNGSYLVAIVPFESANLEESSYDRFVRHTCR
jgi:hypothetical protein